MSTIVSQPVAPAVAPATGRFDFAEFVALAMTVVIGVGAFAWSFAALTDLSVMAGIDERLAWIGPVFVDGAIVQSIVALVSLQRRERLGVEIPASTRWFFWAELVLAELISVAGNALHAAESGQRVLPATIAACVAGAAPLAGLAATHGLTALLDVPRAEFVKATTGDAEATPFVADATAGDSEATDAVAEATQLDADATAVRDAEILRMHLEGQSYRDIGAAVGLHHGSVGRIVARLKASDEPDLLALPAPDNVRSIAG